MINSSNYSEEIQTMRRLTFHRYLERYVRSLSRTGTNSLYKLAGEVTENLRLREPLLLYAMSFGKTEILLRASRDYPVYSDYKELTSKYKWEDIIEMLKNEDAQLGQNYHKVFNSYIRRRDMPDTNNETKRLMHKRIRKLQKEKCISNYRLYTDLKLNPGNTNAFLKRGDIVKISMGNAEKMLEYIEIA